MENITLKVSGMHCSGCEKRVKNALESIKEIKKVNASYLNQNVEITFKKNTVSLDKIKEIIEDLGFKVEE